MNRIAVALGLAIAIPACLASAATPQPDPTFRAKLERSGCYGPCPVYSVEIRASGLVTFIGSPSTTAPDVRCQGRRRWRIDRGAVVRLEQAIDRVGFFGLKTGYVAGITDQSAYAVTVTRRGRTRRVQDYAGQTVGMPKAMSQVENAIDFTAADRDCVLARTASTSAPSGKLQGATAPRH